MQTKPSIVWCILQSFNLTLANLDLDGGIVDASGRGKDWRHGTAQIVRSSTAVFLTEGEAQRTFRGRHFDIIILICHLFSGLKK